MLRLKGGQMTHNSARGKNAVLPRSPKLDFWRLFPGCVRVCRAVSDQCVYARA
jgi:hypothetical protein